MRVILSLLVLFGAGLTTATGAPLSLQQALNEGLKGNLDIQRSELGSEGIDAQVNAAFRSYFPQLTASGAVTHMFFNDPTMIPNYPAWIGSLAGAGPLNPADAMLSIPINWAVTGDIKLTQFLYVPQALTGIAMAKKGKEIDAIGKMELKEGIIFGISMQYWATVYMEENLGVLENSMENLSKTRGAIAAMVGQGIAKKSDLNSMDINLAAMDTQKDNLKVQIQSQKDALLQIMGRNPGTEIDLTDRLSVDSRRTGDISGDPLSSSITLKRMEQQVKLQEMQIDLTRQEIYPNVVAFASYGTQSGGKGFGDAIDTDNFKDNGMIGINVSIPIFDGMSNKAKRSHATIQKRQLELDMEKQRMALLANYENAKATLANAKNLVVRNKENAKLAEENYSMKELEYKEGVAPITDLLTADRDMQTARSNVISALFTEKTAELALEQILGILSRKTEEK